MDISQLNRPQTDNTSVSRTQSPNTSSQSADDHSFDQHLNNSMEKTEPAKEATHTKKSDKNQKPESTEQSTESPDSDVAENPEETQLVAESHQEITKPEADKTVLLQLSSTEEASDTDQQLPDDTAEKQQTLPIDGTDLPLADEVIEPVQASAQILSEKPDIAKNSESMTARVATHISSQGQQAVDPKQAVVNRQQQETPALNLDDEPQLLNEFVKPRTQTEVKSGESKPIISMDAKSASASSIISAASNLQQVPGLTSAASTNLNAASFTDPALAATPSLVKSSIPMPVQSPNWSQGVSERVAWMVQGNFQNAEIKLNPAHLGPLEIKMSVNDDKASISFISAHAPVREALDQAMPRLREMFEQQGLELGDVDVSQYSESQGDEHDDVQTSSRQHTNDEREASHAEVTQQGVVSLNSNEGVSIYA